jgi:hypothetical protein
VQSTGALNPKLPPKSRNSTLVAFVAEASKVAAVPDSVAPFEGMRTLVVGEGLAPLAVEVDHGTINSVTASPMLTKKAYARLRR